MPSLELRLDDAGDSAVRAEWAALQAAGLPSQADHTGESNAPHITVAYFTGDLDPYPVSPPPGELMLGSPLLFRRKRGVVLGRQVLVTRALLDWHAEVHASLDDELDVDRRTRPDAWTPHVTLAMSMPLESLALALETLTPLADLRATPTSVWMWNGRLKELTDLTALAAAT